ncbi:SIS domain-containing protein, partial [Streptomyces sp. DH18]
MELLDINVELKNASKQITEEQIDQFIETIDEHKRIFVYGTGRSGLMLKALAMRLMQIGYQSYVVGETTTPSIEKGDLLIVSSASGETQSVCTAADDG